MGETLAARSDVPHWRERERLGSVRGVERQARSENGKGMDNTNEGEGGGGGGGGVITKGCLARGYLFGLRRVKWVCLTIPANKKKTWT